MRTQHARRGGGGVDAAGGRLRRPMSATRTLLRLATIALVMPRSLPDTFSGRVKEKEARSFQRVEIK